MSERQRTTILSNLDPEVIAKIQKFLRQGMRGRVEAMKLSVSRIKYPASKTGG